MISSRAFLALTFIWITSLATAVEVRPNVLFLMADDWSSPHAGILQDPVVKTPTFDRVAREGVLFANAIVSAPSCTPSRLAIATGQWHWRLSEGGILGGSLREGVPVYAELLHAAGYQIGFARKVRSRAQQSFSPTSHGRITRGRFRPISILRRPSNFCSIIATILP